MGASRPHDAHVDGEERHRAAVARTLCSARESAARGDHRDALAWLATLEAIGHKFSREELRLREAWRAILVSESAGGR